MDESIHLWCSCLLRIPVRVFASNCAFGPQTLGPNLCCPKLFLKWTHIQGICIAQVSTYYLGVISAQVKCPPATPSSPSGSAPPPPPPPPCRWCPPCSCSPRPSPPPAPARWSCWSSRPRTGAGRCATSGGGASNAPRGLTWWNEGRMG